MKEKLNITLDSDLKEVLQNEADKRRTTISALITEFALSIQEKNKKKEGSKDV